MKHVKTYIIGGLIGSMCLAYTSCDSKLDQVNPNQPHPSRSYLLEG